MLLLYLGSDGVLNYILVLCFGGTTLANMDTKKLLASRMADSLFFCLSLGSKE